MLKSKRDWLEGQHESGSAYELTVGIGKDPYWGVVGEVDLTLSDCNRKISWAFGKPGDKRGIRKIKKIKALIDEIHDHLTDPKNFPDKKKSKR